MAGSKTRNAGRASARKSTRRTPKKAGRISALAQSRPAPHFSEEGLARIRAPDGVFFNPHMRQCRDLSSLWVGTRGKLASALDAFCASGARGLRYKMENKNVGRVTFLDMSGKAMAAAKANARLNKIKAAQAAFVQEDIRRFLLNRSDFDLIEIDPFGSPGPHLPAVMHAGYNLNERYLSITATDMAVLCGAHAAACWKNYGAKPMDNEFCHENALRILLGKVARAAAEENWAIEPQFCYSHRHYLKLLLKLTKGAERAVECAKQSMCYAVHCPKCLYHAMHATARMAARGAGGPGTEGAAPHPHGFPPSACPECGERLNWAGPMWGGPWADGKTMREMMDELKKRPYLERTELDDLLKTILDELPGPALYYDLHELASRHKMRIPRTEGVLAALRKSGFFASRTHFSPTAIRTDAPLEEIVALLAK
ncbi:MAG: tRNA (guanine(10)-N(2))-dimethyltransferase [Candidatus Micrarchaeota archaeon]|nr:tRNA (guanine(10)-N(2))-dimethyltransferase [Candidatus Micrarchaeota archaeon]